MATGTDLGGGSGHGARPRRRAPRRGLRPARARPARRGAARRRRRRAGRLPAERRDAVNEGLAGHTLVQAARRLGLPEGTAKSRVRAAYAELRATLAPLVSA